MGFRDPCVVFLFLFGFEEDEMKSGSQTSFFL